MMPQRRRGFAVVPVCLALAILAGYVPRASAEAELRGSPGVFTVATYPPWAMISVPDNGGPCVSGHRGDVRPQDAGALYGFLLERSLAHGAVVQVSSLRAAERALERCLREAGVLSDETAR